MAECMLTTKDNPWNPLTHFDEWLVYDEQMGYHTCAYLARVAKTSPSLPEGINERLIEEAMDDIIALNNELNAINGSQVFPEYVKVTEAT